MVRNYRASMIKEYADFGQSDAKETHPYSAETVLLLVKAVEETGDVVVYGYPKMEDGAEEKEKEVWVVLE
jgi:hypothetical protein